MASGGGRFRDRLARARRRSADRRRVARVPARLFPDRPGRSRRGAFRASDEADDRDRRLCRHPLPGRDPLQEADRHLLAASRGREARPPGPPCPRRHHDLALSDSVVARRDRRRAHDLLGGACLRIPACRRARRHHDGGLHPARRGGAPRQDRRRAATRLRRRHGGARPGLSGGIPRVRPRVAAPGRFPRSSGRHLPAAYC